MITVQAEISFRVDREADAHRILLAIADLVMPEQDGDVAATIKPGEPWQHPHMSEGCPRCGQNVDLGALAGHLKEHGLRGEW